MSVIFEALIVIGITMAISGVILAEWKLYYEIKNPRIHESKSRASKLFARFLILIHAAEETDKDGNPNPPPKRRRRGASR